MTAIMRSEHPDIEVTDPDASVVIRYYMPGYFHPVYVVAIPQLDVYSWAHSVEYATHWSRSDALALVAKHRWQRPELVEVPAQ